MYVDHMASPAYVWPSLIFMDIDLSYVRLIFGMQIENLIT